MGNQESSYTQFYLSLGPTRMSEALKIQTSKNEPVGKDNAMIALLVIWALLIIIFNIFLLVLIPAYWKLRSSVKHLLIFSAAIADLVMGIVVCPMIADLAVNRKFVHGCSAQMSLQALSTIIIPSVTTWAVFLININYILRMTSYFYCEQTQRIGIALSLAIAPWVLTIIITIPQLVASVDERKCSLFFTSESARIAIILTSFAPQCIGIFVTFLAAFIMYMMRRDELCLDIAGERLQAPSDICLVSFLTVLMYTSQELLLLNRGTNLCSSRVECEALFWISIISTWQHLAKSFAVPMAWTFCHQLRDGVKYLWELATWNQKF